MVITIPLEQYPHWEPFALAKASWIGCGFAGVPIPSLVVMVAPLQLKSGRRQAFTARVTVAPVVLSA